VKLTGELQRVLNETGALGDQKALSARLSSTKGDAGVTRPLGLWVFVFEEVGGGRGRLPDHHASLPPQQRGNESAERFPNSLKKWTMKKQRLGKSVSGGTRKRVKGRAKKRWTRFRHAQVAETRTVPHQNVERER